jgi:DNA-binding transcriptional regulator YdaS (Cro superfamily)
LFLLSVPCENEGNGKEWLKAAPVAFAEISRQAQKGVNKKTLRREAPWRYYKSTQKPGDARP